jgi:hypothetical protein
MKYDRSDTSKFEENFERYLTNADNFFEFCGGIPPGNKETFKSFLITEKKEAYEAGRQSIIADTENVINNEIIIHKQLESECVGSIENIKSGRKGENPHTFVIEQLQVLKSQIINKLKG